MDPMLVQTGIAAPLVFALMVYTARDRERGSVQSCLFWLLAMIFVWMIGMVAGEYEQVPRGVTALLSIPPACFMAPLFLLLMLLYSRVEVFERRRGPRWALMAPFFLFLIAFFTHDQHGLMADPAGGMTKASEIEAAGPLFWAFQAWSNLTAIAGLIICVRTGWVSHSR